MFRSHCFVALLLTMGCCAFTAESYSFGGANSFYLHSYRLDDQIQVLDAMKNAGMKALRIFISPVGPNAKGSNNYEERDVENPVGVWDDSVLQMIDGLMLRAYQRGIKLIITLHDRYSLGCWAFDAYFSKYNIPAADSCGNDASQNDLNDFYNNPSAAADMDRRFAYIASHRNPNFGNRPWSNIPEAILAFGIQNEGQAHQRNGNIPNRNWICDRARKLKPQLSPGVLISTGGGAAVWDSILPEHFQCPSIDIVAVHSYGDNWGDQLPGVIQTAKSYGKRIYVEEFGSAGNSKSEGLKYQIDVFQRLGVPWIVWQVNKPNNQEDLEVFTDDGASWNVLSNAAWAAPNLPGAFNWPEMAPGGTQSPPPPPSGNRRSPPPSRNRRPPPPSSIRRPPPPSRGPSKCDKCNLPLCRGGCKCDNNCDCRPGLGGYACDKCNMAQNDGGCKCDNMCACKAGTCWF